MAMLAVVVVCRDRGVFWPRQSLGPGPRPKLRQRSPVEPPLPLPGPVEVVPTGR